MARTALLDFFAEQVADRRASPRENDLITELVQAEVDGELRAALQVFLERIPEFELIDPHAVTWAGGQVHGPRSCEVRFDVPTP